MSDSKADGVNGAQPPAVKVTAQQLTKLRDANLKYKNLLKMAKQRIETQEEELKLLRGKPHSHLLFEPSNKKFIHIIRPKQARDPLIYS